VHGFGFASVLREFGLPAEAMGLALLAFNVGVEAGQAAIVLVAAPLFALVAGRGPAWRTGLVGAGSCVVAAAGAWWFFERVFSAR
ncbi:MAG: HupE/UreJ family protein, partial [Candidatus Eisenbacteria bacterium]